MAKKTLKPTKRTTPKAKPKTARRAPKNAVRSLTDPSHTTRPAVAPYLAVNNAAEALAWYKKVFNAKIVDQRPLPNGQLMHAEVRIGDGVVWLSDIMPGSDVVDPTRAGASVTISIWNKNADKFWQNAVANGAKVTLPIDDMFWGDRYGKFLDPYGHSWSVSTKSKLSKKALEAKAAEAIKQYGATQ